MSLKTQASEAALEFEAHESILLKSFLNWTWHWFEEWLWTNENIEY
jgi:hypothetical protein